MSEFTTLMARDGHEFNAWLAAPAGKPRGAIVVIQENLWRQRPYPRRRRQLCRRRLCGHRAGALRPRPPRHRAGLQPDTMKEGMGYVQQLQPQQALLDLAACIAVVKHAGRVGVVGFCWGGKLSYISACELPIACGVAYYGGGIAKELGKTPQCPMLYHFGARTRIFPGAISIRSGPRTSVERFISIRMPITASTATCARASMPRPRNSPGSARWPSSRTTCAAKRRRPTSAPAQASTCAISVHPTSDRMRAHRHPAGQYGHARQSPSCATSAATWRSS